MHDKPLIDALLPAVQEQLESPETPYVKAEFTRLVEREGLTPEQGMEAIALCLADEANRMLIDNRKFDEKRYRELLGALPGRDD